MAALLAVVLAINPHLKTVALPPHDPPGAWAAWGKPGHKK